MIWAASIYSLNETYIPPVTLFQISHVKGLIQYAGIWLQEVSLVSVEACSGMCSSINWLLGTGSCHIVDDSDDEDMDDANSGRGEAEQKRSESEYKPHLMMMMMRMMMRMILRNMMMRRKSQRKAAVDENCSPTQKTEA